MLLLLAACAQISQNPKDALPLDDTGHPDSGDTGGSDTGDTDSGDTGSGDTGSGDTGDTDSGDTDSGDTDSGDTDSGDTDSGDSGDTAVTGHAVTLVASGLGFVLDAIPSPDGSLVYFVGNGAEGVGLYVTDGSTSPTAVSLGWQAVLGLTLGTDGATAYVSGRLDADADTHLYAVSLTGDPTPRALTSADGYNVGALDLTYVGTGDRLTVNAVDPSTSTAGVYTLSASGSAMALVGDGFGADVLTGVVRMSGETAYATGIGGTFTSTLYTIPDGSDTAVAVQSGLSLGSPSGIASTLDGSTLLLSASTELLTVDVATGTVSAFDVALPSSAAPAGLHRAHDVDRFALAVNGGGGAAVYTVDWP